eukprot:3063198-Alexandrium_andersonii.AAC.2
MRTCPRCAPLPESFDLPRIAAGDAAEPEHRRDTRDIRPRETHLGTRDPGERTMSGTTQTREKG